MAKKQSSEELSSLGARYMRMSAARMRARYRKSQIQFFTDFRRLGASVVSQDEKPKRRKRRHR